MSSQVPAPRRRVTIHELARMKAAGDPIAVVTAYDATAARWADAANVDVILVGDSLGMVVQGHDSTLPVTLDQMVYHGAAVRRGLAKGSGRPHLVVDMPFGSYHASADEAVKAAARLVGLISADQLEQAVREELADLHMPPEEIEHNVALGRAVFAALTPMSHERGPRARRDAVRQIAHDDPKRGSPTIFDPGNAALRHTGTWRVERPIIDLDHCTRCGLCLLRCPDGAVSLDEKGYPVIDYDHCKGCMICREICPLHAVEVEKETRAW